MSETPTGAAPAAPRLTGDEYMALLVERRDAYYAEHGQPRLGFPALLEWFIRDGDEDLFTPPEPTPQPKSERKPRTYKPASHWRERLARIDAELAALDPGPRHGTTDPAAYGGIGVRQTARQDRQWGARIDRAAERYVRLTRARNEVAGKLARAETRESA